MGSQAQAARQTVAALQRQMEVLQGGDWVGQGASAFYLEMSGQVLPALRRLASALEATATTTQQISQIMSQAEAEAARVLRGDGQGASGANVAGGLGFAGAGPAGGGNAGGGGGAGGSAGGAPAAARPAGPGSTFNKAVARALALDNAAVDERLAQFSPGVREMVKRSPTLRAEIGQLQQDNISFKIAQSGQGYFTDPQQHSITIEQPASDVDTVQQIAHEVGHAMDRRPFLEHDTTMTRDEYVAHSVKFDMQSEGMAQLNAAQVRAELNATGGPDIKLPGHQEAAFQQVYDDLRAAKISRDEAVDRMAALMGNETVSLPPHLPYPDFYRDRANYDWDTHIDQPPLVPTRRP